MTEHLLVARALRESEERFRMLLAAVKDFAIFMLELKEAVAARDELLAAAGGRRTAIQLPLIRS